MCAAEDDQLKDPVITVLLSIRANLWWSLCRYKPLVEGKDPELLKVLEALMNRKRQGRTTHAYRVLRRYGGALRSEA